MKLISQTYTDFLLHQLPGRPRLSKQGVTWTQGLRPSDIQYKERLSRWSPTTTVRLPFLLLSLNNGLASSHQSELSMSSWKRSWHSVLRSWVWYPAPQGREGRRNYYLIWANEYPNLNSANKTANWEALVGKSVLNGRCCDETPTSAKRTHTDVAGKIFYLPISLLLHNLKCSTM